MKHLLELEEFLNESTPWVTSDIPQIVKGSIMSGAAAGLWFTAYRVATSFVLGQKPEKWGTFIKTVSKSAAKSALIFTLVFAPIVILLTAIGKMMEDEEDAKYNLKMAEKSGNPKAIRYWTDIVNKIEKRKNDKIKELKDKENKAKLKYNSLSDEEKEKIDNKAEELLKKYK